MGDKINNVGAMLNNPRQRNIYLMAVGLAIVTIVVGVMYASGGESAATAPSGAQVATIPNVQAVPGTSDSSRYNEKVLESNALGADKALEEGKSFVATPVNTDSFTSESPIDALDKQVQAQKEQEQAEIAQKQAQAQAEEQQRQQEEALANQMNISNSHQAHLPLQNYNQTSVKEKEYGSNEDFILVSVLSGLSGNKQPKSEFDYVGQKPDNSKNESVQQAYMPSSSRDSAPVSTNKGVLLAKAGTILNAVLETGVNSDEPSPVLAKIVSGNLKGGRLMGKISVTGKKVILQFSRVSLPTVSASQTIDAVAVDPDTNRTSLASDVDNHYFLRYGVMLSAAFLGNYADALKEQNQTCTDSLFGQTCRANGNLTSREMNQMALGGVGKEIANDTRSSISGLAPTITVNAGIPIGILVMEDMYLSKQ